MRRSRHTYLTNHTIDLERGREGAGTVVVSTSAFYERCQPLVERTLATLEEAMQGLGWGAVAALYVVGGASALRIGKSNGIFAPVSVGAHPQNPTAWTPQRLGVPLPALASRLADLVGQHEPWRMQRVLLSLPFGLPSLH